MGANDQSLREVIRGAGLRATKSRVAVLRLLCEDRSPRSHAEVFQSLSDEGWDRATLYRNLTDLTDVGLLRRLDLGDRVWRFEIVDDQHSIESNEHPHFLCTSCGDIQCLPETVMSLGGTVPQSLAQGAVAIQVRGLCDTCHT